MSGGGNRDTAAKGLTGEKRMTQPPGEAATAPPAIIYTIRHGENPADPPIVAPDRQRPFNPPVPASRSHPRPVPASRSRPKGPSTRVPYLIRTRSQLPNVALEGL
jgi:hypothetical protein